MLKSQDENVLGENERTGTADVEGYVMVESTVKHDLDADKEKRTTDTEKYRSADDALKNYLDGSRVNIVKNF